MAKPYVTLTTVPAGVNPGVLCVGTLSTTPSPPLCRIVCVHLDGKVSKWKGAHHCRSSTRTTTAAVVADQFGSQLETELLQRHLHRSAEVPQEDEAVRDGDIKQEVVHIFVELPGPLSALIVPPELVTVVHSSHKAVVQDDSLWTWDTDPGSVQLPPLYLSDSRWLTVRPHRHHNLSVLPSISAHWALLDSFRFSTIR